jgi:hypothetical protein
MKEARISSITEDIEHGNESEYQIMGTQRQIFDGRADRLVCDNNEPAVEQDIPEIAVLLPRRQLVDISSRTGLEDGVPMPPVLKILLILFITEVVLFFWEEGIGEAALVMLFMYLSYNHRKTCNFLITPLKIVVGVIFLVLIVGMLLHIM